MILINEFESFARVDWGAADTETLTYIDNKIVRYNELQELGRTKDTAFFRKHAFIRVWAWQFSDGVHFFVTNDFNEFCDFLCEHKVSAIWFYNAKFDFAQIDYQLFTHVPPFIENLKGKGKAQAFTFKSLHNERGARFSLKLWLPFKARGAGSKKVDRHEHVHAVTFYDFNNIFGGGLKRLLEEFNVVDFSGAKIRKSEMDYQAVDETQLRPDEVAYLKNDTHGLYHLIRIADEELQNITGYKITGKKPDIMTAGGLAKKMLLRFLFPNVDEKQRVNAFQREHCITPDEDLYFRIKHLYNGGLCFLNEHYTGKLLTNVKMFRFDVNSEYPFIMHEMPDVYGHVEILTKMPSKKGDYAYIYEFEWFSAELKKNKVACFRNPFTGDYEKVVNIQDSFLMFADELNELLNWYDIDYRIKKIYRYKTRIINGFRNYVDNFFKLKNESKKSGEKAKTAFAKLLLNSSYGKLAERVVREITFREINEETQAVHLVRTGEEEVNERGMLSVVQGAFVTSQARVWLLSHIRKICNEDVEKNFIYCDTDSVHTFCEYDKANAYDLGAFKNEGSFNTIKYIAPKCYADMNVNDKNEVITAEFHTKGLSLKTLLADLCPDGHFKSLDYIDKRFDFGQKYQPLCGLNVKGGKGLFPLEKYLAKPINDEFIELTESGYQDL